MLRIPQQLLVLMLLGVVAIVGAWGLPNPSALWRGSLILVTGLILAIGGVIAWNRPRGGREFWMGFAVWGGVYLALSLTPVAQTTLPTTWVLGLWEERWLGTQRGNEDLVWLRLRFADMETARWRPGIAPYPLDSSAELEILEVSPGFAQLGHTIITLGVAWLGAVIHQWLCRRQSKKRSAGVAQHRVVVWQSMKGVLATVLVCGLGFAALSHPSWLWARGVFAMTVVVLVVSGLKASELPRRQRGFWSSFAIFGGVTLALSLNPDVNPLLPQNSLIDRLENAMIQREAELPVLLELRKTYMRYFLDHKGFWIPNVSEPSPFDRIAASLLALGAGWLGGVGTLTVSALIGRWRLRKQGRLIRCFEVPSAN